MAPQRAFRSGGTNMAKPVWQQKLQAKLDANPMCFVGQSSVVKHRACLAQSEKPGRKITLIYITNYNCFNTCAACGVTIR